MHPSIFWYLGCWVLLEREVGCALVSLYAVLFSFFFVCFLRLVYNLTNNVDVENTKVRMEQYQRDNRDVIQRNKAKLVNKAFFFTLTSCSLRLSFCIEHHSFCLFFASFSPQTREQEELEELLLLEQQSSEQRRLEVLQEEQRQLQTKRKNKQALLDELVRNTGVSWCF